MLQRQPTPSLLWASPLWASPLWASPLWDHVQQWLRRHLPWLLPLAVLFLLSRIDTARATDLDPVTLSAADSLCATLLIMGFACATALPPLAILFYGWRRSRRLARQAARQAARQTAQQQGETRPAEEPTGDLVPEPQQLATSAAWSIGFASHPGRVRGHNEDAGTAFCVGGHQVAIVADGVGGSPMGGDASAIAVRAAERAIRYGWRAAPAGKPPAPGILLQAALASAGARLAAHALRRGFVGAGEGLRTTLIAVIATADRYRFGYIGDGGIFVVRADGTVDALMEPQKAQGEALNVLAASLGPFPHGAPVFGSAERRPADLLVAATDGVADRLQPRFYSDMLVRHASRCKGDFSAAANGVLTILANHVENERFRFDDNMTLALIGDGRPRALRQTVEAA
ncbi:MAG: protein phosphatase 2C domain-containing protein [Alphaproteobacteria bacterium]|nr:protein phosphatase 2C domain-containing protein [Alphaproteobacteria bacterium]